MERTEHTELCMYYVCILYRSVEQVKDHRQYVCMFLYVRACTGLCLLCTAGDLSLFLFFLIFVLSACFSKFPKKLSLSPSPMNNECRRVNNQIDATVCNEIH